jgi:hypothetical protein
MKMANFPKSLHLQPLMQCLINGLYLSALFLCDPVNRCLIICSQIAIYLLLHYKTLQKESNQLYKNLQRCHSNFQQPLTLVRIKFFFCSFSIIFLNLDWYPHRLVNACLSFAKNNVVQFFIFMLIIFNFSSLMPGKKPSQISLGNFL